MNISRCLAFLLFALLALFPITVRAGDPGLFNLTNLTAWCVVPFDAKHRGPEARAQMLEHLGFKTFAYDWRTKDIPSFDEEVDALKKHHVRLAAWWFPTDAADPNAKTILDVIRRHGIHPQLWVMGSGGPTKSQAEQDERIAQETDRISKIVQISAPYGCQVELYNHNGWFGQPDNEVAIIERLKSRGISGVGMIYNFSHGHADAADFPQIWKRIAPYVVAVNVTGMVKDERLIAPGNGDDELTMMRTIQESGWRGPVGVIAEQGGDAEVALRDDLAGFDRLKKELANPGGAGPRPRLGAIPPAVK